MKTSTSILLTSALGLALTACGSESSDKRKEIERARANPPIQETSVEYGVVLHSVDTSSLGIGNFEQYKVCQKGQPGNENLVMILYSKHKKQLDYDKKKEEEAKQAGKEFVNTWSAVRSVEMLDACPSGAAGRCEVSNIISYYYTNSPKQLASFKETCGFMQANIWTKNP